MILALDTSTAACTAALFAADGSLFASRDELIGRGHAERLVPMIDEMLDGHVPLAIPGRRRPRQLHRPSRRHRRRTWPWHRLGRAGLRHVVAGLAGGSAPPGEGPVAAAMAGGHGELFVQQFDREPLSASGRDSSICQPPRPRRESSTRRWSSAPAPRRWSRRAACGEALPLCLAPPTPFACRPSFARLEPKPLYARAPDARPREAA